MCITLSVWTKGTQGYQPEGKHQRVSGGDMSLPGAMPGPPLPSPITELAVDDGYEYGGGVSEYIEEGLMREHLRCSPN